MESEQARWAHFSSRPLAAEIDLVLADVAFDPIMSWVDGLRWHSSAELTASLPPRAEMWQHQLNPWVDFPIFEAILGVSACCLQSGPQRRTSDWFPTGTQQHCSHPTLLASAPLAFGNTSLGLPPTHQFPFLPVFRPFPFAPNPPTLSFRVLSSFFLNRLPNQN